ncbi:peptide chain release factor N(5)-glutamine methyltransferase [Bengtsoniella intestinalis]|uniref:peptide chain release factor N(5)-glutamine methyltransferase n=1 Tax=Bengtsoniella intestinalis TaxID=3073143 RepID=UPI00391EFE26
MAITYHNLYLDLRRALRLAGAPSPDLEARELVCFATGKTKEELLSVGGLYISNDLEHRARALLERHLNGEPVAYLIGEWEFYGLPLDITPDVLIPRPDTEVLVDKAIAFCNEKNPCRILDLCAGSGCVGLALASQLPHARVILGELSEGALKVCRQNTRRNGLTSQVSTLQVDALVKPASTLGTFDCLVSNPPYIPSADVVTLDTSVKDFEPLMALDGGDDGLDFYRYIAKEWKSILKPNGGLYFEVGIDQAEAVMGIMADQGFGNLEIVKDLGDIPRVVYGTLCQQV